jgi:hypothetical protein
MPSAILGGGNATKLSITKAKALEKTKVITSKYPLWPCYFSKWQGTFLEY